MAGIDRDQTTTTEAPAGSLVPDSEAATDSAASDAAESVSGSPASLEDRPRRSDVDSWARPVSRLATQDGQAPLDTVRGKRPIGAVQGFGQMWQKTFRVQLGPELSAREVVSFWREHFSELWPKGNEFYAPLTGITPGEVALLQVGVMPAMRLSTGVVVIYVDDESFTFMTPQGHVFAGWVTWSAADTANGPIAQIQLLIRAQSPLTEFGMMFLGGQKRENRFFQSALSALAAGLGAADAPIETQLVCVDRRRQWRRAGNIRHDASFRSALYTAGAPLRWARRSMGRH